MKFLHDFTKYLSERKSKLAVTETEQLIDNTSEEVAPINEAFDSQKFEYKIIISEVTKDYIRGTYALFYEGKEFYKGQTEIRKSGSGYYEANITLNKPEYPVKGKFDIHISSNDAKKDAKLVAKIVTVQNNPNTTAIFNAELTAGGTDTPPIPEYVLDLGSFFAPNIDTIDEAKKNEVNTKLKDFETYFNTNKNILRQPGAPVDFNIIGGASQVSTTYAGGNQKLAEARANNLKNYMIALFKTSNPDLSKYVAQTAEVTTVMGQTPYIDVKTKYAGKIDQASIDSANKDKASNDANKAKYDAEQFVKLSIKAKAK